MLSQLFPPGTKLLSKIGDNCQLLFPLRAARRIRHLVPVPGGSTDLVTIKGFPWPKYFPSQPYVTMSSK
jgi:hypothetical protein